jgi:hypothetical protein
MAWYVFALLDAPPRRRAGRGLSGPLTLRDMGACYVALERRGDVPPVELGALTKHHAVVARLWKDVPALLPVRFGTLLDAAEIAEALEDKDEELKEAFDRVRARAQFSWRGPRVSRGRSAAATQRRPASSGTEYLRRAALASIPPPRFSTIRRRLAGLVAAERYEPSRPAVPEALYHLVDRKSIDAYLKKAAQISSSASITPALSGPFPPYAFVPELLA